MQKHAGTALGLYRLELEVDERLHVGCYELVDHEHCSNNYEEHHWNRQEGEVDSVPSFPAAWQPVDDHSYYDEDEYFPVICYDVRDHGGVPPGAYLIYHVLGCIPCLHVCSLWIEVAAAPEEQTGEGDEYECLDDTPYISQSLTLPAFT